MTGLKFLETAAAADGQITAGAKIYELASAPNTPGVSQAGMVFRPGRYIVGISVSNGEGAYQFAIEAEPAQGMRESEPNDDHARATALSLNGLVPGDAAESDDVFQLVIDKRASARRFHIDVTPHPTSGLVLS